MKKSERVGGLYLCQFSQGTLKVGMGVDIGARLVAHRSAGAVFEISVSRTDIVPCDNPRKAERLLIEWCAANSSAQTGREWFSGVDYLACLNAAKQAAAAMMGPHPYRRPKPDMLDMVLNGFKHEQTKEAELYAEVRVMLGHHLSGDGVAAFDWLHRECEKVRAGLRAGMEIPAWYDLLNCFGLWEIELWFDDGKASAELLAAAAVAIGALADQTSSEVTHA